VDRTREGDRVGTGGGLRGTRPTRRDTTRTHNGLAKPGSNSPQASAGQGRGRRRVCGEPALPGAARHAL